MGILTLNLKPSRIEKNQEFVDMRKSLITKEGGGEKAELKVDDYLKRRLAEALEKFGSDYVTEMSARIDRIFELRESLADGLDRVLINSETLSIDKFRSWFDEMSSELDQLKSPKQKLKDTQLELPGERQQAVEAVPRPVTQGGGDGGTPPTTPGGRGGGEPPSGSRLREIAGDDLKTKARKGAEIVEQQNSAPNLERQLVDVAQRYGRYVARRLLWSINKFLSPEDTQAFQGMSHFLEGGGDARQLARLLDPRDSHSNLKDFDVLVPQVLGILNDLSPDAQKGIEVYLGLSQRITGSKVLPLFELVENKEILNGIFESIHRLEKRSEGLQKVIAPLTAENSLQPEKLKGVQGQLLSANQLLDELPPDATLVFEETMVFEGITNPRTGEMGDLRRRSDITVKRPGLPPRRVEVKFLTSLDSIDQRVIGELAKDIILDHGDRRFFCTADGRAYPPFGMTHWRLEKNNLANEAAARLSKEIGIEVPRTDIRVKDKVVEGIKDKLRAVFDGESGARLRAELGTDFDAYLRAFTAKEGELPTFIELY